MHHLERNARLDQRLEPAQRMVFALGSTKPGGLLRIDQPNASERALVPQVFLPARVTAVDVLHRLQPSSVMQHARELGEPRPPPAGDAIRQPEANRSRGY